MPNVIGRLLIGFMVCAACRSAAAAPSLNLHESFADTKQMLAAGSTVDVLVLGDSLSFRPGSYLPYFRDLMQAHYGNAGAGYQGFSLWTDGGFNSGWSNGQINADSPPHHSLDGLWASSDAKPYPPTHTSARFDAWDATVELYYLAQPGGGRFRITLPDGTLLDTLDTDAPTAELRTWSHTFTDDNRRLWYQSLDEGARVTLLGQNNLTADTGIRIHRAANGGWGVDNFLQRDWTFDAQVAGLSTDLAMVWIGQNDQSYAQADYYDAVGALVNRLRAAAPDAEIVLIGTYDQGSSALAGLVAAMEALAFDQGVGFLNLYETAGDAAFFEANGYLTDGVHFSDAGGAYLGQLLFDAFITDGTSLTPEPALLGPVALAAIALLRRRRSACAVRAR